MRTGSPKEVFPERTGSRDRRRRRNSTTTSGSARRRRWTTSRSASTRRTICKSRPGWMRNLDYCDGMITNWGTHLNDIAPVGRRHRAHRPGRDQGDGQISTTARSGTCWSTSTPGTSSPTAWSFSTRWARRTSASRATRAGSRSTTSQDKLHPESLEASDPAILEGEDRPGGNPLPAAQREGGLHRVRARAARPDAGG